MTEDTAQALRGIERAIGQLQGKVEAASEAQGEDRRKSSEHREKVFQRFDAIERQTADAAAKAGAAVMEVAKVAVRVETLEKNVVSLTDGLKANTGEISRMTPIVNAVELAQHRTKAMVWLGRIVWGAFAAVTVWLASIAVSVISAWFTR